MADDPTSFSPSKSIGSFEFANHAEAKRAEAMFNCMSSELERLSAFAREMFELADWPEGGDIDGFAFQDACVKHGLLIAEPRTERCGEVCHCADDYHGEEAMKEGVTCYRKAPWLTEQPGG